MGAEKEIFSASRSLYLHHPASLALLRRFFRGHWNFSPSGPKHEDVPPLSFLSPLELLVWEGRDGSRKKKMGTCEAFVRFYSARSVSLSSRLHGFSAAGIEEANSVIPLSGITPRPSRRLMDRSKEGEAPGIHFGQLFGHSPGSN